MKKRYTFASVADPTAEIKSYITDLNAALELIYRLHSFAGLSFQANTADETAMRYVDQMDVLLTELTEPGVKFQRYLTTLSDLDCILNSDPLLTEHAFLVKEQLDKAKYMLSDQEEILLALLRNTGSTAWGTLQSKLTSSLMITLDVAGETKTLPLAAVRNLANHDCAAVRKAAYEAELSGYERIDEAIAFALNSIKGEVITVAKLRGYASPLEQSALSSRIDLDTLNAMISAIKDKLPVFRKYMRRKGEILGHKNGLPFYDMFAPVLDSALKFTYEEAAAFIIKNFGSFSPVTPIWIRSRLSPCWAESPIISNSLIQTNLWRRTSSKTSCSGEASFTAR